MTTFAIIGWLFAAGLGTGWWIDRRGLKGIISDLKDVKRETGNVVDRARKIGGA